MSYLKLSYLQTLKSRVSGETKILICHAIQETFPIYGLLRPDYSHHSQMFEKIDKTHACDDNPGDAQHPCPDLAA